MKSLFLLVLGLLTFCADLRPQGLFAAVISLDSGDETNRVTLRLRGTAPIRYMQIEEEWENWAEML